MPVINKKKIKPGRACPPNTLKVVLDRVRLVAATAIGEDLDRVGELFGITRHINNKLLTDQEYRERISAAMKTPCLTRVRV